MSINSDKLGLVIPDRGEFPGEWDTPLNANLELIDLVLWKAYTHNPTDTQPDSTELLGSSWYKIAEKMLMIKGVDGYHAAARHNHTGGADFSKVLLTNGTEVQGMLPGSMVDSIGLNAQMLGGKFSGEFVSKGGTGIEVYTDTDGQGAARILPVIGFGATQEFTRVTVDLSGRVISGQMPNTLSGLGITDAVTKQYADATYATNARVDDVQTGMTSDLQAWVGNNYAAKHGDSTVNFAVTTNTGNPADAVSVSWASTFLASKNGDMTQSFSVKDSVASTAQAVPRSQADTLYSLAAHLHDSRYLQLAGGTVTGALQVNGLFTANGSMTIPSGKILTVTDLPVLPTSAANRKYVDDSITAGNFVSLGAGDGRYAKLHGDNTLGFQALAASTSAEVVNLGQADARYAVKTLEADLETHKASGDHDDHYDTRYDLRYAPLGGQTKNSYPRNTVISSKLNGSGNENYLSINGTTIDIIASPTEPLVLMFAHSYTGTVGAENKFAAITANAVSAFTSLGTNTTKYIAIGYTLVGGALTPRVFDNPITNSYVAPAAPADGTIWKDLNTEQTFRYDLATTTWVEYPCVPLASVTTNGAGAITNITYITNKIADNIIVSAPVKNESAVNKGYVDAATSAPVGPMFKITPEGGYAVKMINLSGANSVKGTIVQNTHGTIAEAGDTSNQLSGWEFYGQTLLNTNLGTVYWELLWTLAGQVTTINIFKDVAKTQLVASGTRSGNTTAGTIALLAQNASGLTGSVAITGGANPTVDNDGGNTLGIGVQYGVSPEEAGDSMPVGIMYDDGVPNGGSVWVVTNGMADILLMDATTNTPVSRGGLLIMSATVAGRADYYTSPAGLTTTEHFREVGHNTHGVQAGTNRLVRSILHWN